MTSPSSQALSALCQFTQLEKRLRFQMIPPWNLFSNVSAPVWRSMGKLAPCKPLLRVVEISQSNLRSSSGSLPIWLGRGCFYRLGPPCLALPLMAARLDCSYGFFFLKTGRSSLRYLPLIWILDVRVTENRFYPDASSRVCFPLAFRYLDYFFSYF